MAPFQHGTNCNAASSSKFVFIGFEAAEICFDLYSILSGNPVLAIQKYSTCSPFVQEYSRCPDLPAFNHWLTSCKSAELASR